LKYYGFRSWGDLKGIVWSGYNLIIKSMESPSDIIKKLENQIEEIEALYALAENAYPYPLIRGDKERSLNEDTHRRDMVAFSDYGLGSAQNRKASPFYGLAAVYLYSRRGAKHLLDFSQCRKNYALTFGFYMVGVSFGTMFGLISAK
jgi:hypothetical protein